MNNCTNREREVTDVPKSYWRETNGALARGHGEASNTCTVMFAIVLLSGQCRKLLGSLSAQRAQARPKPTRHG